MNNLDIQEILKQSDLFSSLPKEKIVQVEAQFNSVCYPAGTLIFKEGDSSDKLYVVYSGEVVIYQELGMGSRELDRLGAGRMFGEMALIIRGKRSAFAKAETQTTCLELSRNKFLKLIKGSPELENQIEKILVKRIENTEQKANKSILQAYNSLLFSLSNLVESRDHETGGHLNRVQRYCRLLAEKLAENGLFSDIITPLFIENIFAVSPMHDIGKVAIPDAILKKPGKLTFEEFATMKSHAAIGAEIFEKILQEIPFPTFELGYNLTHYHHERYDGSGYPTGIAGDNIPLEARIMALADVYDALLSKRCYKKAFSNEEVIRIIEEGKGTHFDPVLTETLLANIDEFSAIHLEFLS